LENESALSTSSSPSLEEESSLALRAREDFEAVKHMIDDGRVSHLDVVRLNNRFRQILADREIVERELAQASYQLSHYVELLGGVELDLVNDNRDELYELDSLMERLPPARHADARAAVAHWQKDRFQLLQRRQKALEGLAARAEQTQDEILKRLSILDEEYGFIRTHIFWVRDQEPIDTAALIKAKHELGLIGRTLLRLSMEPFEHSGWGHMSAEFLVSLVGVVTLPGILLRARRWIDPPVSPAPESLPPSHPTSETP
jgi:hypothetical protein